MTTTGHVDIDLFMQETGNFGRFEIMSLALLSVSIVYTGFSTYCFSFTAGIINHRCFVPECELRNTTVYEPDWVHRTMNFKLPGVVCKRYKPTAKANTLEPVANSTCPAKWFNKTRSIKCSKKDLIYQFDDFTIMHEFDLQCDKTHLATLVGTIHNTGQAVGYTLMGIFSDKYGRKPVLIICIFLSVVFGFLHLFSQYYYDFIVYELLMGCFTSGIFVSGFVLGIEIVGKKFRTIAGACICTFQTLGVTLLGVVSILFKNWRTYSYIHLLFLVCGVYYWFLIESPRWLVLKRRDYELEKKLLLIAHVNGFKYSVADLEQFRIKTIKREIPSITSLSVDAENTGEQPTAAETEEHWPKEADIVPDEKTPIHEQLRFSKLLRSKILLCRILNCYYCWITICLVFDGLQLAALSAFGDRHINFIITGLVEVPANLLTPVMADHFGRRSILFLFLLICATCNLAYPFLDTNFGGTIIYFLAKFAVSVAFAVVTIFSAELFPTEMRNTIIGTCGMVSRVGSITAPQWQVLNDLLEGLPFYIFAFTCATSAGFIFLLPETLHVELPDSIEEAEHLGKKPRKK